MDHQRSITEGLRRSQQGPSKGPARASLWVFFLWSPEGRDVKYKGEKASCLSGLHDMFLNFVRVIFTFFLLRFCAPGGLFIHSFHWCSVTAFILFLQTHLHSLSLHP